MTEVRQLHESLSARLAQPGLLPGLTVEAAVELGPRMLPPARLRAVLDEMADCGELALLNPPDVAYPQGARVVVLGRVASDDTRRQLRDRLIAIAGDREVTIDTEVLNPTLCTIDAVLPDAPAAGFHISYSQGETGEENPTGRFFVGENPVIDVTIPADIQTGFLMVSAVDVSGNVFQLLPNLNRPENRIEALRGEEEGPVTVRVAYPLEESQASGGKKLAFVVDDTALGQSRIMVINAETDILDGLRPTTESAESFAAALAERTGAVRSLDSRILTTARP
jgi:serine/threonine-protein kinase